MRGKNNYHDHGPRDEVHTYRQWYTTPDGRVGHEDVCATSSTQARAYIKKRLKTARWLNRKPQHLMRVSQAMLDARKRYEHE